MIKPIVQREILKGWSVDPDTYFGSFNIPVAIEIDPNRNPGWINNGNLFKVAVQAEPPSITNGYVENYLNNFGNKYDLILTYYPNILENFSNSRFLYFAGTWIRDPKDNFSKDRLISFITSNKNFAVGHHLRMEIVDKMRGRFDLFGRGFNEIDRKDIGLDNYMFSIAIENISMKNYFTEKIMDCFLTKTVPIYYGCTNIGDFYDRRGIIEFQSIEELDKIIQELTPERYSSMIPYIEDNYNKAKLDLPFNKRVENLIKEEIL
jgi:hypothetical protein